MLKKRFVPIILVGILVFAGGMHKQVTDKNENNTQLKNTLTEKTPSEPDETPVVDEMIVNDVIKEEKQNNNILNFSVDPNAEKYLQLDSKNFGWGFKKEKNMPPDIPQKTVDMFEQNNTYFIDKRGGKVLYLTFDEGYENGYTGAILDVLKEKEVPAAFFITMPYLKTQQELVDRMVNEGHVVGNHTVNHPNLAKSDLATVRDELLGLDEAFREKYGESMIYMRPPEGEYSEKMLSYVSDIGYKTMLWSFAYKDWDVNLQQGAKYAFDQVVPYLHDGAILLLHAVSSDNAGALADIIDYARSQGYEFKSIEDIK